MFCKKFHLFVIPAVFILAALILATPTSSAEDWPGVFKKIQTKYENYDQKIQDMITKQEIFIKTGGREITTEATLYKKHNKFRMDSSIELENMPKEMGPMTTVVIHNGQDTWMVSSMMGKQKLTGADEKQYQTSQDWWSYLDENAELAGSETVGNRDCYVIKINETVKTPYSTMWLDKTDLVLVKGLTALSASEKIEMNFSEFKKLEKEWLVPYKTDMYLNGELISTVTVLSIETNQDVPDELFDIGKVEVNGPSMEDMMKMMQEGKD
jgi:outer membrane lipoprotein-sorting protein